MTDVSEKLYQFTVFTLVELTDAMRMISDQAMKHNGNTSAESQFLVIANGLSQLNASVNGMRRKDIKVHYRDTIAPDEAEWGEDALVIDPCNINFVLDKLDDVYDELKNQIKSQKAPLFCRSRFSKPGHSAKSRFYELEVYKAVIGDLTDRPKAA